MAIDREAYRLRTLAQGVYRAWWDDARVRVVSVILGSVLLVSGCAGVTRQVDVPRAPSPHDTGRRITNVSGYLTKPDGGGPFGAVVLLHGCPGLPPAYKRLMEWAEWYRVRGWVSIAIDSFAPRGLSIVCNAATATDRAGDAYAAMRYLAEQPFVKKDRVVVHGMSHGGWTVLRALDESMYGGEPLRFAAGIAYYPVCANMGRPLYAPGIVLIGELDDTPPGAPCRELGNASRGDSHPIEVTIYPGAYHAFDFAAPRRVNDFGMVLEYSPAATADAEQRVDAFLRRLFPRP